MFGFDEITPELLANLDVHVKAYFQGDEMKFIIEIGDDLQEVARLQIGESRRDCELDKWDE
jgi:hypothetical protein